MSERPAVTAVALDDEQRGRLLSAPVAAGLLRGGERVEQPLGERPACGGLERSRRAHRRSPRRRGCCPARRSRCRLAPPAQLMHSSPVNVAAPAEAVDDPELTVLRGRRRPPSSRSTTSAARAPRAAAPDRRARSAGWRTTGSRSRRRAARPTGTTEPTARNFDCVATPHCPASRSQAQIEYVATAGSGHRSAREVEVEQRRIAHERACHLRAGERRDDLVRASRPGRRRANPRSCASRSAPSSATSSSTSAPSSSSGSLRARSRAPACPSRRTSARASQFDGPARLGREHLDTGRRRARAARRACRRAAGRCRSDTARTAARRAARPRRPPPAGPSCSGRRSAASPRRDGRCGAISAMSPKTFVSPAK